MGKASIFHILLIIILGLLAYSNAFNVPFQFDDRSYIIENPLVKDIRYFIDPSAAEKFKNTYYGNYYYFFKNRFIGYLSLALNYKIHRLDVIGYHIFNLSIHIINALLVYWLVTLTFKTPYFRSQSLRVSKYQSVKASTIQPFNYSTIQPFNYLPLFIALIFVSHPIQTQAVTYISQRFASLATLFYLLSLVMYIKSRMQDAGYRIQDFNPPKSPFSKGGLRGIYVHRASCIMYLCSLLSAILAMKTKEISFTLPFIIALYEFSFLGKSRNYELRTMSLKRFLYLLPFLSTLIIIPLNLIGADKSFEGMIGNVDETAKSYTDMSRWDYLFTEFRVIVTYIRLLFLPINQNLDYDYPVYNSFLEPNVFLSFLFLLAIFSLGIYLWVKGFKVQGFKGSTNQPSTFKPFNLKLISFGIFWFFITSSVESSIIPIEDVIFEHRIYLPSVGIMIAFSVSVFYILYFIVRRSHSPNSELSPRQVACGDKTLPRFLLPVAYSLLTTIIIVLSIATYQRNTVWQDEVSLWEDVVKKSPKKARGYNNLGFYYFNKGMLDEALLTYQTAVKLRPNYSTGYCNIGAVYLTKGFFDEAIEYFNRALIINPNNASAHYNLGTAYESKGQNDMAIEHFRKACSMGSNSGCMALKGIYDSM